MLFLEKILYSCKRTAHEGKIQVSWQTLPCSGKVHTPLYQLGCCRRASLRKQQPSKPWQAPEQEIVKVGSSEGHHDKPLSPEGTFTLRHVGKPARTAEQFQTRGYCSQNTRSSGTELSLLSSPPCSAGQHGVNQDYLLWFKASWADSWHTGRLLWELLCPQHEPGHCLGRGRTQATLCFSRIMATAEAPLHAALPAHLSQEQPALWSMPGFAETTGQWIRLPWLVQIGGKAELKLPTVCSLKLCATFGIEENFDVVNPLIPNSPSLREPLSQMCTLQLIPVIV